MDTWTAERAFAVEPEALFRAFRVFRGEKGYQWRGKHG